MKEKIIRRMTEMTVTIAKAYGGEATIEFQNNTGITFNDPSLVDQMLPSLQKIAGTENVKLRKATTGGEDFSFYQEKIPVFFFFLGGMPPNTSEAFPYHTPIL